MATNRATPLSEADARMMAAHRSGPASSDWEVRSAPFGYEARSWDTDTIDYTPWATIHATAAEKAAVAILARFLDWPQRDLPAPTFADARRALRWESAREGARHGEATLTRDPYREIGDAAFPWEYDAAGRRVLRSALTEEPPAALLPYAALDGDAIRLRRQACGMTQEALGEALGVAGNTVARWERRELAIDRPRMVGLALESIERAARSKTTGTP